MLPERTDRSISTLKKKKKKGRGERNISILVPLHGLKSARLLQYDLNILNF